VEIVKHALTAFESYYHYLEIADFEQAINVILTERDNKWQSNEWLGHAFYRLGLVQRFPPQLSEIVKYLSPGSTLSGAYHILGDMYGCNGRTQDAIKFFKKSERIAIEFNLTYRKLVAWQNIGIINIDLGEHEEAEKYFNEIITHAEATPFHRYAVNAWFCLAYISSCKTAKDSRKRTLSFVKKVVEALENTATQVNLTAWGKGHSLLFLGLTYKNLGESLKSFDCYHRAISFSDYSHYPLVKAVALSGLAELHREAKHYKISLSNHLEAIELLEEIGAKNELAEASYQLGITYHFISEFDKSSEIFEKTLQMFGAMGAPKQVERVRRSMNGKI